MANNLKNIIEKIKIAELDPSKTYFLQICIDNLNQESLICIHEGLKHEFEKYNINNIMLITPNGVKVKFTEIGAKND